jgi:hypothetical protein
MLDKRIKCIGTCGSLHLFVNTDDNNRQDDSLVKGVVIKYDKELCPYMELIEKYDTIEQPMTFNAFELYDNLPSDIFTSYLLTNMPLSIEEDLNKHLVD